MPEVFTEENKDYYTKKATSENKTLSNEEVLKYRQYYSKHSMTKTYDKYLKEH